MKKVLFVVPSLTQTNGIASFIFNYISRFKEIEVSILSSNLRPSEYYLDFFKSHHINVYFYSHVNFGIKKSIDSIKDFFKSHNEYDIVYSNVVNQSYVIFKLAKKYKIKIRAIHAHATQSSFSMLRRARNYFLEKLAKKYATNNFACSVAAGKAFFGKKEFVVINNAVDYKKYSFDLNIRKKIRMELGVADNDILLGFVGRFSKQKNIYFLSSIMKLLPEKYKMIMIGTGPLKEDFVAYVSNIEINKRFYFIDECSNVNEFYSAMDCFLLPSIFEGLPVVGIEAQINGLNCIFSNKITSEIIISNNSNMLPIIDPKEWADLIEKSDLNIRDVNYYKDYDIDYQASIFEKILDNL